MDFLSLELDKSGTKDILFITYHFTKFAVAIPTPNQKAQMSMGQFYCSLWVPGKATQRSGTRY